MHTKLALPRMLLPVLILGHLPALASAQTDDDIIGFSEALACPATGDPATGDPAAGANVADGANTVNGANTAEGAADSRSFDYSLLQKKRQQLASQKRPSPQGGFRPKLHGQPDFDTQANRSRPLTGRQKKLRTKAAAAESVAPHSDVETPEESTPYRSLPDEPEPEEPSMPLPTLSTALSAHGQAPLQRQTASAATGLHTGTGPQIAASGAAVPRATLRRGPVSAPSRAQAILRLAGGV